MNQKPHDDGLVRGLQRYRQESVSHGLRDPFSLSFPGEIGDVPQELARKFSDLDAAFGATISMSLRSEWSPRRDTLAEAILLCESPIEARFLLSLICSCSMNDQALSIRDSEDFEVFGCSGVHGDSLVIVRPQLIIDLYRVDFAVELTFTEPFHELAAICGKEPPPHLPERISVKLVVECDGHIFHEKTAHQARRDKSRDRNLLRRGYPVMRFTGSEISADPLGCSNQVVNDFFGINKASDE